MRARVLLHGTAVGELSLSGDQTVFRFDDAYLRMSERPVLGRWFEDQLADGLVLKGNQSQLPSFFQNYLPEVNSPLRELLARRANVRTHRELPLLCALGTDLPGAIVVTPLEVETAPADVDEAPLLAAPAALGPLRFSLAGMQLKFSVVQSGTSITLPVTGEGGRFILKIPTPSLPSIAENEHAMMTWAGRAGIVVPRVELVDPSRVKGLPENIATAGSLALLVERFDRPAGGGARIHQEDFAQVVGVRPDEKYGRDARVTYDRMGKIIASVCGQEDFVEFIKRLVFVVLMHNRDAHLKNWSFWYPNPRRPRLAPAYDLVSAVLYPGYASELACRLANEWDPDRIQLSHFGVLAKRAGFAAELGSSIAEEAATRMRATWPALATELDVPSSLREAVDARLARVKLG